MGLIQGIYGKVKSEIGIGTLIGQYTIIDDGVQVGKDCKIGHRVTLKAGTIMKNNSIIDDHCCTTGACYIGEHVNIRTGAIISKATIIEDWVFIGPGVITNHTKHVDHGRTNLPNDQLLTYISFGSIIGSQCSIVAGVYIGPHSVIGAGSVITKDIEGNGVYFGDPVKRVKDLPEDWKVDRSWDYPLKGEPGQMYLRLSIIEQIAEYVPGLRYGQFVEKHSKGEIIDVMG